MNLDKQTQEKIQEMQSIEQNLQNFLLQKQNFQAELSEVETALQEVEKTHDEVYKISGQVMIKAGKDEVLKELKEKQDTLNLRIKTIEKQESNLRERLDKYREEIEDKLKNQKK